MPSRTKKILIISSALLVVCLFFLGVYNFAFKERTLKNPLKKETAKTEEGKDGPDQAAAKKRSQKIYAITDEAALSPVVTADGDHIRYYAKANGHVYEVLQKGGGRKTLSDRDLPGLVEVLWSPDKNKVITTFDKGGFFEKHYFDYITKTDTKLASTITAVSWANLGDKILYKYTNPRNSSRILSQADPDGKNWKNICDLPWQNLKIAPIPRSSLISFWNAPNSFEESALKIISPSGGDVKTIFEKRYGADYLWSPDGNKVLISSSDAKSSSKITLSIINSNGGEYQNLNIPTLVDKCAWSRDGKTVYYALPGSVPEGSVMPNDYLNGTVTTKDTFWKINIETGKQERLVELKEIIDPFDAVNLFLSATGGTLYFTNRIDGKLYAVDV